MKAVGKFIARFAGPRWVRKPRLKGRSIAERIALNRAHRLAIARAMKLEAGVNRHTVLPHEDLSGVAFLDEGVISSPQGRNMAQLMTLAHECGHIFLHSSGPGRRLPAHVQEMEAECYAHQAFREYGMMPPPARTKFGRDYVGEWIRKDIAKGIRIDTRALEYSLGKRSPYEPLRKVPNGWRYFRSERRTSNPSSFAPYLANWSKFALDQFPFGFIAAVLTVNHATLSPIRILEPNLVVLDRYATLTWPAFMSCIILAVVWVCVACMLRTLKPRHPA